tara:strand:+ start:754 stop:1158 length:405 start_codon:yes stop_codon:yes gene_type:complete
MDLDIDYNNDFIFFEKNGELMGGGVSIQSELLKQHVNNSNDNKNNDNIKIQNGGASILKDLAVPAGLFLTQQYVANKSISKNKYVNASEHIETSIYDKLLDLVDVKKQRLFSIKTHKKREPLKRKTRRNARLNM